MAASFSVIDLEYHTRCTGQRYGLARAPSRLLATIDELGYRTTYTYGRFGNRLNEQNALGYTTTFEYDSMGYQTGMIDALGYRSTVVYNAARQKLADVGSLGYRTSYVYDGLGRLSAVQSARGYLTTNVYDARDLVARVDALGFRTTMAYDALGRQVAVQTPLGYRSATVYDAAGQVAQEIDALGYRTSFGYDAAGNRVTMMDANGYVSTSIYFANSNLLRVSENPTVPNSWLISANCSTTLSRSNSSRDFDLLGSVLSFVPGGALIEGLMHYASDNCIKARSSRSDLPIGSVSGYVPETKSYIRNAREYRANTIITDEVVCCNCPGWDGKPILIDVHKQKQGGFQGP